MKKNSEMDFDFLGIFRLADAKGIEKFVEPLQEGDFLSRNYSYYLPKTCKEASQEREELNKLLPMKGAKAFVIVERMLNNSCRVYYELFRKSKDFGNREFYSSKLCLEEDVQNIVTILKDGMAERATQVLPESEDITNGRFIEADNKHLIYKAICSLPKYTYVISPLYGGILLGPFFKALHSARYDHILFGAHDQQSLKNVSNNKVANLEKIFPVSHLKSVQQKILIYDDNVGTGKTLAILKNTFESYGKQVDIGALEMSWDYFDQVSRGIRQGETFDFSQIDHPTYRSTRHHSIADTLVKSLSKSGDDYLKTLKSFGFNKHFISDDVILYFRGRSIANHYKLSIDEDYSPYSNLILSVDIMNRKIRYMEKMEVDEAIKIILNFPQINIIDIDRYQGESANMAIIKKMLQLRNCRVGGGIKHRKDIEQLLNLGAEKVIVGTHANESLLKGFPRNRIVVAIDSTDRKTGKSKDVPSLIKRFKPFCDEFQYVCVETDGKAQGGDVKNAIKYAKLTTNKFNCVGGIAYKKEIEELAKHNIGCVIGRAIEENYYG